ncbi:MAG: S41 family peptidase [Planctomycetota bacterium]
MACLRVAEHFREELDRKGVGLLTVKQVFGMGRGANGAVLALAFGFGLHFGGHGDAYAQPPTDPMAIPLNAEPGGDAALPVDPRLAAKTDPLPGVDATPPFRDLADAGRFDDLLEAIRLDPVATQEAQTLGLIDSLRRHHRNRVEADRARRLAFESAKAKAAEKLEEGELYEAIIDAIEAHSLADEPEVFLHDPLVVELTRRMEIDAKQAELDGDWLEASLHYDKLELLYEDQRLYLDDMDRVGRHIRALNIYHPEYLERQIRARNERLGKPNDDRGELEFDDWQTRLAGIKNGSDIVRSVMRQTTRAHIEHHDYEILLQGAIASQLVLLDTADGLGEVFPSLLDQAAAAQYRAELVRIRQDIDDRRATLSRNQAGSYVDRIFAANQRTVKLPDNVLAYELTEGALGMLDDFTAMYWPEDIDNLRRSTQGAFFGVGIQIRRLDNRLIVVSPLPGTPAYGAGIRAGDEIDTVDGKSTAPWSLTKAVRQITGPEGTEVTLGIRRVGEPELIAFVLERKRIDIESIKGWAHTPDGGWDFWLDRDAGIGYVRLTQFIPQSVDGLREAIEALRDQGPLNGLILDLRFNPGGLLTSAIQTANLFVHKGPLLYTVDQRGKRKPNDWEATRSGTLRDLELVVLINRGSASASEIVSGVLQDHDRALVVGTQSFGKGSVQNVFWNPAPPSAPDWGLKVTTEYYQLPEGAIIHRTDKSDTWGITPDLVVEPPNQTVLWALDLRQELDIVRDADEPLNLRADNPAVKLAGLEPLPADTEDRDAAAEKVPAPGVTPDALLDLGLDPQLEAALLVLKARALSREVVVAKAARAEAEHVVVDTP